MSDDLPPLFMHIAEMNIGSDNLNVMDHEDNHFGGSSGGGINVNISNSNSNCQSTIAVDNQAAGQSSTWSEVNASGEIPPARSGAASVIIEGILYIFGGYGGGTGRLDDFYSFSFEENEWREVEVLSDERPGCRENNGVVASGDSSKVYLFGGYNGNQWLNDLWVFDIESKRWECIQESSDAIDQINAGINTPFDGSNHETGPSRRFGYVSVVHDDRFVLFGGFDGSRWLNDMWEFSFETKEWQLIQPRGQMPSARSCPAWAKDETHVYIIGGYDGLERKNDFFACNLNTYEWHEILPRGIPPSPRYFHSCCLYNNNIIVYGGYSGTQRLADMYSYDFDTGIWSRLDCSHGPSPSGRSSLVAQVYENSLYIFGGYNGGTVLNDFYRFRLQPTFIPQPTLLKDMKNLINNETLSDVTFSVEGRQVHANRSILAVRSEYFNALLFGGAMRESIQLQEDAADGTSPQERRPIDIKDVSYPVFIKVLEYIYTDKIDVSPEMGIQVLITSELYMLDRLKALCEDVVRRDINVDNAIDIFLASHRHGAGGLKDIVLEFIVRNLNNPVIIEGLTDLKSDPDLLVEIIRRNSASQTIEIPPRSPGPFARSGWSGSRR